MPTGIEYTVDYRTLCFRAEEEVRDLHAERRQLQKRIEDRDRVIKDLKADLVAHDKVIGFVTHIIEKFKLTEQK